MYQSISMENEVLFEWHFDWQQTIYLAPNDIQNCSLANSYHEFSDQYENILSQVRYNHANQKSFP